MSNNIFKIENGVLVDVLDKNITEVVLPNDVTIIGSWAFCGCKSLASVTISNSVTSIDSYAFCGCTELTSITIPDSVTSIGDGAFSGCTALTSISIPNNVKSIDFHAFSGCTALTSVTISDSVTCIYSYAFSGCTALTSVTIPDSVTCIDSYAFYDCTTLTSITIPESVTNIACGAFSNCTSLKSKISNYKAFKLENGNLVCIGYRFAPNKWSKEESNIEPCERGYHYCTNLFEIFDYYSGELDKDIAIYECEVGDKVIGTETSKSSKCCTNKIKPVKRLYKKDIIKLLNV